MKNRAQIVDENFVAFVSRMTLPDARSKTSPAEAGLSKSEVLDLFETQVISRMLDLEARILRGQNQAFYTIGSSGHEANAAIAKAFAPNDIAFLHYRSSAFMLQRAKQVPGSTAIYDILLSLVASSEDPISGGRHKVIGSKPLFIPPQTSTIASHLPKAMGTAYSIARAKNMGIQSTLDPKSIVCCSFGDASASHSTALGAMNATEWINTLKVPMPIMFVCEDNGIGISVRTPKNWIHDVYSKKPILKYFECDGLSILDTYRASREAVAYTRTHRRPAFLHFKTVRLMGHAGSDVETTYRNANEIQETEFQDPLLHSARILMEHQLANKEEILSIYQSVKNRVDRVAQQAKERPKLETASQVMETIVPKKLERVLPKPRKTLISPKDLEKKLHMARLINFGLTDLMNSNPEIVLFGEDVARKGGVYNVTSGLNSKFGNARVFDSLLDEQSILGVAMGMAHNGFLPIPEIQFLAYVHNAEDQIRGEAASLPFFSMGQYDNPMVIRIAGLAYQKGFGGHFHNDNSLAVFRDIPGLILAVPSNGADAVKMMRTCVRAAQVERRVVVFVEPIALYMTKDLDEPGDNLWSHTYPEPGQTIELGEPGVHGDGTDLCIITYGNGFYYSREASRELDQKNIKHRILDLRWLNPINEKAVLEHASACRNILVVDECRDTGSVSEKIGAILLENRNQLQAQFGYKRIVAQDSFIPLGNASTLVLPSKDDIVKGAIELIGASRG